MIIFLTVLIIFQIVFLLSAAYFTFKIARANFTPSRAWYLLMSAKIIFIIHRMYSIFFLSDVRKIAFDYAQTKIIFSHLLLTAVCFAMFVGTAELYAIFKVKYSHDA